MTIRHIVTAGCSFSECINWYQHNREENRTWPVFLSERLSQAQHHSEAMGSAGNGLIARRTWYRVNELLKTHAPEEILVGVMWTSRDRFDFYFEEPIEFTTNLDGWIENPTRVVPDAPGGWVICNPHWTHQYNAAWYKNYYNEVASQLYTLEHITNLQTFLKLHGVPYFFTSSFATHINPYYAQNANCAWLHDQIDWGRWLPVESERHWVLANCDKPEINNFHPHPDQHELFVDQVIMPWLKNQNILTTS